MTDEQASTQPESVISFPKDDGYLLELGRALYANAYFRWSIVGDIETLAPSATLTKKAVSMLPDGQLAKTLKKAANNVSDPDEKRWLNESSDALSQVTPKRNQLAHSYPATMPEGQRLYRWANTKNGVEALLIDLAWLRDFLKDVNDAQRDQSDRNTKRKNQLGI